MCPGYAVEDGAALHFRARSWSRGLLAPGGAAWCVGDGGDRSIETALPTATSARPDAGGADGDCSVA